MKLLIAVAVPVYGLAVAYCVRNVYYALKGRHSPEAAWIRARVNARHLDHEHAELTRVNPRG